MKTLKWILLSLLLLLIIYIGLLMGGVLPTGKSFTVGSRNKTVELYSLKGTIYDRHMIPLTNVGQQYYYLVDPRNFAADQTETLAKISGINVATLKEKLEKDSVFVLMGTEKPASTAGLHVFEGLCRYGDIADHLVGYINSDLEGVSGLEKSYSSTLSYFGGTKSLSFVTDGRRNPIVGLGFTLQGEDGNYKNGVVTTLDAALQRSLESAMDQYVERGAAVILDAQNGDVLALVSRPDFDAEHIEQYLSSEQGELINRALVGQTVGSVFKIVIAAAALENDLGEYTCNCTGSITVGNRKFTCPVEGGHGEMALTNAFAESCNVYFIALGQMLGTDKVMEMTTRLGFGESFEIAEGLYCSGGVLPDVTGASSKQLANISLGQGDLMASPIQIARLVALCGNGGYLVTPTCFQGFYVDGTLKSEQWLGYRTDVLSEKVAEEMRRLCIATVEQGTGAAARPEGAAAGGKTSSAQTGKYTEEGVEILNTYFAGFFPAENPRYAIAVFAENGRSGGKTCAPVFKAVCEDILHIQQDTKKD